MNIQDNYQKNRKNIFFSENKDIETHREKLINIFENDRFDKKNNESLKNINLKNFIDFKYKYLIPEETSVINNNQENSYSIVSVNGQCSSFKDDKIEITKILDEDYNDFSKNDTIENNITDKAPSTLKPGYWKREELDDKKAQSVLKIQITAKKNDDKKNKVFIKLLYIILNKIINFQLLENLVVIFCVIRGNVII